MGNGGPIALPPYEKIEIGSDGTISIRPQGGESNEIAEVDRIKLVKASERRAAEGRRRPVAQPRRQCPPPDADARLASG